MCYLCCEFKNLKIGAVRWYDDMDKESRECCISNIFGISNRFLLK